MAKEVGLPLVTARNSRDVVGAEVERRDVEVGMLEISYLERQEVGNSSGEANREARNSARNQEQKLNKDKGLAMNDRDIER